MSKQHISRRHFIGGSLATIGTVGLPGCGGGTTAEAETAESTVGTLAVKAPPTPLPVVTPGPSKEAGTVIPPGAVFTSLRVTASQAGAFVYTATVLPLQGQVPNGATLLSPDDSRLSASVLSRWPDGSAAVMVASGVINAAGAGTSLVRLQAGSAITPQAPMTAGLISKLVSSVQVSLGTPGTIVLNDFSKPERIWWANNNTVCARYRAKAPNHATLEAVVDIHVMGERAQVEVVVENGRLDSAAPVRPNSAVYSAAVTVNGQAVASVQSSGAPEGNHAPFRAWYASGWVGGDPGVRAMQDATDLQKHPLLFRCDQAGVSMSVYANDSYVPWGAARQRGGNMGGAGDHPSIGPLPQWEAHLLQTGDPLAARAVEASALSALGFNISYRDANTGWVPTLAQVAGRSVQSNWPSTYGPSDAMTWKLSHHPAVGLMAFISRPAPVYIELAQKVALWNAVWSNDGGTPTGIFGRWYQMRGKAWCLRSLAHALFLTPQDMAWRPAAQDSLAANINHLDLFRQDPRSRLNSFWEALPTQPVPTFSWIPGFTVPLWQHHYLVTELHKVASAALLPAAAQATANTLADWAAMQPVRWINEQPTGGWRYVPYGSVIGRSATTIDSPATWGEQQTSWMTTAPDGVSGPWMACETVSATRYSDFGPNASAGAYYPGYLWAALVTAVERNVSGASQAWQTVQSSITGLDAWRRGFAVDPRWGSTPRRVPTPQAAGWGSGSDAGSVVGNLWTPGRDSQGVVNAASLALLQSPPGTLRFYEVANTRLDSLDGPVKVQMLAKYGQPWRDTGVSGWNGVTDAWVGLAHDTRRGFETAYIGPGGGHDASSNNGMYRYDVRRMTVNIQRLPTPSHVFPAGYRGATVYPSSFPVGGDVNGVAYDEIFDRTNPADPVRSSREPTSRHTYQSQVFVPDMGAQGSILMCCRRAWRYDIATNTWSAPRAYFNNAQMETFASSENMMAWWDSAARRYYHMGNNASNSGDTRNFWWDGDATFGLTGAFPYSGWRATNGAREQVGQTVWVMQFLFSDFEVPGKNTQPAEMARIDLNTQTIQRFALRLGASFNAYTWLTPAQTGYWDQAGVTFIAPLNKFLACTLARNVSTGQSEQIWFWIDASTWVCEVATDLQGAVLAPYRLEGKIKYFPEANLVVHFTPADKNLRVARVA